MIIFAFIHFFSDKYYEREITAYVLSEKEKKLKSGSKYDDIVLGDSRTLAINYCCQNESNEIYNYSFPNVGGIYQYVYFLQKYLRTQPKPKKILWSFIPLQLTDHWEIFKNPSPSWKSDMIYRSSKLYSVTDIIKPDKDNIFYRHPDTTKNLLYRKLFIDFSSVIKYFIEDDYKKKRESLFNKKTGGLIFAIEKKWTYDSSNELEQIEFNISERSVDFIKQFLELSKQNSIKVFLFNMPIPDTIYRHRIANAFYKKYFDTINQIKQLYPDTFFVYDRVLSYDDSFFCDGSHMNYIGAKYFQSTDYPKIVEWINSNNPSSPLD